MVLSYLHSNQPGSILRQARTLLGLDEFQVVNALLQLGDELTIEMYRKYEADSFAAEVMPASRWYLLCRTLCLPSDVIVDGYSRELHLAGIQYAIDEESFTFEVKSILLGALSERSGLSHASQQG